MRSLFSVALLTAPLLTIGARLAPIAGLDA